MIKDENELFGELIKIENSLGKIDNSKLSETLGTDNVTLNVLMDNLSAKRYIIKSMDISSVTDLGKTSFISKKKRFIQYLKNATKFILKELFVFFLGILSGLLIAYFSWKFNWI